MSATVTESRPRAVHRYQLESALATMTPDERAERGKAARTAVPRESHAVFDPPAGRPDPIDLLEEQSAGRVPELVPVRYGRMMVSPFDSGSCVAASILASRTGSPLAKHEGNRFCLTYASTTPAAAPGIGARLKSAGLLGHTGALPHVAAATFQSDRVSRPAAAWPSGCSGVRLASCRGSNGLQAWRRGPDQRAGTASRPDASLNAAAS